MTVSELIEKLNTYLPSDEVVVFASGDMYKPEEVVRFDTSVVEIGCGWATIED